MENSRKFSVKKLIFFIGGIVLNMLITLVVPQILSAYFSVDIFETLWLLGGLMAMGIVAWFGISFFLYIINKEKDSLTDDDVQQVYNEENIQKHERCLKYVDVCSISRALNRPGLKIDLDPSEKEFYRLYTPKEIYKKVENAKEIIVVSEQFSALNNIEDPSIKLLIKEVNRGLKARELYVSNPAHEDEIEQMKLKMLSQVDKKYQKNLSFEQFESSSSIMGNAFTSFAKIVLISDQQDNDGFYSEGYIMFYTILGEEDVYYKMSHCTIHQFMEYLNHGHK